MTFIPYRTKNVCMKIYSEYLYIIKFIYHTKNVCETVWMAAMELL